MLCRLRIWVDTVHYKHCMKKETRKMISGQITDHVTGHVPDNTSELIRCSACGGTVTPLGRPLTPTSYPVHDGHLITFGCTDPIKLLLLLRLSRFLHSARERSTNSTHWIRVSWGQITFTAACANTRLISASTFVFNCGLNSTREVVVNRVVISSKYAAVTRLMSWWSG